LWATGGIDNAVRLECDERVGVVGRGQPDGVATDEFACIYTDFIG
jgi:hypothetical protein